MTPPLSADDSLLAEYDAAAPSLGRQGVTLERLLKGVLSEHESRIHKIESRVKGRESLKRKIERKSWERKRQSIAGYKSLADISDIVGLRVITYYEDDVALIARTLRAEFREYPLDSVDKRWQADPEKFSYASLHIVVSVNDLRCSQREYSELLNLRFEIQVRSLLQHAWAEIEHDLIYKGGHGLPLAFKHDFARLSASLELADREFCRLRRDYRRHWRWYFHGPIEEVLDQPIDGASLLVYLRHSSVLEKIESLAGDRTGFECGHRDTTGMYWGSYTQPAQALVMGGILTIRELDQCLLDREAQLLPLICLDLGPSTGTTRGILPRGQAVWYLGFLLLAERFSRTDYLAYVERLSGDSESFRANGLDIKHQRLVDLIREGTLGTGRV